MANPFKMAEQAKKKAPGSKQEHEVKEVKEEVVVTEEVQEKAPVVQEAPVVEEAPVEQAKVEEKPEEKPVEKAEKPVAKREKKTEKAEKPALDIFAKLETEKPSGKTYAFYLSDDNVAKLKKMAEKNKISASKLLDHILSEVL